MAVSSLIAYLAHVSVNKEDRRNKRTNGGRNQYYDKIPSTLTSEGECIVRSNSQLLELHQSELASAPGALRNCSALEA